MTKQRARTANQVGDISAALPTKSIPVVGMGASAGGLEAFMLFFDAMPPESGMAFVLIQHLDPDHKSLTAELLARHTKMPVHQASDQIRAAKENGRNRIHVYCEQDVELAARHGEMKWVARINLALEDNRFRLALQPIVPINGFDTNKLSYEVLIRMQDGEQCVQPDEFLGAAERYNLSSKLDCWVIRSVFKWFIDHRHELEHVALININLSGQSLGDKEFLRYVIKELTENPIPAQKICFEITETAAITNFSNANRFMHAVKQLGCVFALDDFGTGLSSFEYLKALPVEYLKVSGLFVKDITSDSVDLLMVKAISDLAHEMGKRVIAETVENQETLDCLVKIGVDYAQGYFTGKPIMMSDLKLPRAQATDLLIV